MQNTFELIFLVELHRFFQLIYNYFLNLWWYHFNPLSLSRMCLSLT